MLRHFNEFEAEYSCEESPFNPGHEVGCPHKEWTKEELQKALDSAKHTIAFLEYLAFNGGMDEWMKDQNRGFGTL